MWETREAWEVRPGTGAGVARKRRGGQQVGFEMLVSVPAVSHSAAVAVVVVVWPSAALAAAAAAFAGVAAPK